MPERMVGYGKIAGRAPSYMAGEYFTGGTVPDANVNYQDMAQMSPVYQYSTQGAMPVYAQEPRRLRTILNDPMLSGGAGYEMRQHYQYTQNMQAQSQRTVGAGTILKTGASIGTFAAGAAIGQAAIPIPIVGGLIGGLTIGGGLNTIANGMMDPVINQRLRQQAIMADTFSYRNEIGLRQNSASYANEAGRAVSQLINRGSGSSFFNAGQKSEIFKTGLAEGLISAKSSAPGADSGSVSQLTRNVKELFKSTEEIVKLMNVTKEGGLALIKEMRDSGFGNISQITSAVRAAKAFGGATGLGPQNLLSLASSGAAAVQGTPYSSQLGASTYMQTGINVGYMSQSGNVSQQRAIAAAGGVGAASQKISNLMLNTMSSDIGTHMMAAMMNSKGDLDPSKVAKIMNNPASAYQISSMANTTGYNMGSRIAMMDLFKMKGSNAMAGMGVSPEMFLNKSFEVFKSQFPYADKQAALYDFARQMTPSGNINDINMAMEYMTADKNYFGQRRQYAASQEAARSMRRRGGSQTVIQATGSMIRRSGAGVASGALDTFEGFVGVGQGVGKWAGGVYNSVNDYFLPGRESYDYSGAGMAGMEGYYGLKSSGLQPGEYDAAKVIAAIGSGGKVNAVRSKEVQDLIKSKTVIEGATFGFMGMSKQRMTAYGKKRTLYKGQIDELMGQIRGAGGLGGGGIDKLVTRGQGTGFIEDLSVLANATMVGEGREYKTQQELLTAMNTVSGRTKVAQQAFENVTGDKISNTASDIVNLRKKHAELTQKKFSGEGWFARSMAGAVAFGGLGLAAGMAGGGILSAVTVPVGLIAGAIIGATGAGVLGGVNKGYSMKSAHKAFGSQATYEEAIGNIGIQKLESLTTDGQKNAFVKYFAEQLTTARGKDVERIQNQIDAIKKLDMTTIKSDINYRSSIANQEKKLEMEGKVRGFRSRLVDTNDIDKQIQAEEKRVEDIIAKSNGQVDKKGLSRGLTALEQERAAILKGSTTASDQQIASAIMIAESGYTKASGMSEEAFKNIKSLAVQSWDKWSKSAAAADAGQFADKKALMGMTYESFMKDNNLQKTASQILIGSGKEAVMQGSITEKYNTLLSMELGKGSTAKPVEINGTTYSVINGQLKKDAGDGKGQADVGDKERAKLSEFVTRMEKSSGDPADSKQAINPAPPILNYWNNRWIL